MEEVALREEVQVCAGVLRLTAMWDRLIAMLWENIRRYNVIATFPSAWIAGEAQSRQEVLEAIWPEPWFRDVTPHIFFGCRTNCFIFTAPQAVGDKETMPENFDTTGKSGGPSGVLSVIAASAICFVLSVIPAGAQFEFLFGRPEPTPPAATAKPAAPKGGQAKPAKVKPRKSKPKDAKTAPATNAPATLVEEPPPPFDSELLKLAEILGALAYLDELCATKPLGDWREKMKALLDAEAKTNARKEWLAGSYNRGFRDYERTYHFCTQNAQVVIGRFLADGGKIAHEVVSRYGGS